MLRSVVPILCIAWLLTPFRQTGASERSRWRDNQNLTDLISFRELVAKLLELRLQAPILSKVFSRERSTGHSYSRQTYGVCWCSLYYCSPFYYLCKTIPGLRVLLFRLFGYREYIASIDPNTLIREVRLYRFGMIEHRPLTGRFAISRSMKSTDDSSPLLLGASSVSKALEQVAQSPTPVDQL